MSAGFSAIGLLDLDPAADAPDEPLLRPDGETQPNGIGDCLFIRFAPGAD